MHVKVFAANSPIFHKLIEDVEFITLVSSEAQDICEKSQKKTMMPEQIVQALKVRAVYLIQLLVD